MDPLKAKKKISKLLEAAMAEHKENRITSALNKYKKILNIDPNHGDALHLSGLAFYQLEQKEKAIHYVRKAIKANNNNSKYWDSLAMILTEQQSILSIPEKLNTIPASKSNNDLSKLENISHNYIQNLIDAENAYIKSISLNPNNYLTFFNLGSLQRILLKTNCAIKNLNTAISLNSKHKESYNELGLAFFDLGEFQKAILAFNSSININNGYLKSQLDKSLALIASGNFKEGWEAYEIRTEVLNEIKNINNNLQKTPYFTIEKITTDTPLVIFSEQGIGDEIMFSSLIPELINRYSGEITIICNPRLIPIFQRSFPTASVRSTFNKSKNNEHKIFFGSLPNLFRSSELEYPPSNAYLTADKSKQDHFANKYNNSSDLKIGISWRGGPLKERIKRSIKLSKLLNILQSSGCKFFNLQYGDISDELGSLYSSEGVKIINDDKINQLKDLDTYTSFISTLDLIITVDNSTAHIAGALGIPTWVMLPFNCDWRWLRGRNDSIWYKSVRLYRQKEIGNWSNVIEEVTKDLADRNIQPRAESKQPAAIKPQSKKPQPQKQETKKQKNIAFLNDTSEWYHWGCTATSAAIRKRIAQHGHGGIYVPINHTYNFKQFPQTAEQFDDVEFFKQAFNANNLIYNAIEAADCVVINGEGSIHHLSPVSLTLLYIAYAAKKFKGKQVHIINHSPYPANVRMAEDNFAFQLYRSVYNQLDYIAIREHISHKLMTDYGTKAELSFDCLPITVTEDYTPDKLDSSKNIVISGSVSFSKERIDDIGKLMQHFQQQGYKIKVLHGAKSFPAQDDILFIEELKKLEFNKYEVIDAKSLTEWFDCINSASAFVSGRFHHSLAAIYLETPCVMMESNTLKNVAIAESFNQPSPIQFSSESFFEELLQRTEKALVSEPVDSQLRKKLLQRAEVNFAGIKELG